MLINRMLREDTESCDEAMKRDLELSELEKEFYAHVGLDMMLENIFTAFMARVTRIAYLQGMKDFAELCGLLKCDTNDILEKFTYITYTYISLRHLHVLKIEITFICF